MKISGSASRGLHEHMDHVDPRHAPSVRDDIQVGVHSQLRELPRMRRSVSAKEQSRAFVADSSHLDALFGSIQPARGKQLEDGVHRTPIQTQEIETLADGNARIKINSTRLFVSTAPALDMPRRHETAKLSEDLGLSEDAIDRIRSTPMFHEQTATGASSAAPLAQRLRLDDLRDKKVEYKWNIASNGSLVIGEGHPGVVLDEPMTSKSARKKKTAIRARPCHPCGRPTMEQDPMAGKSPDTRSAPQRHPVLRPERRALHRQRFRAVQRICRSHTTASRQRRQALSELRRTGHAAMERKKNRYRCSVCPPARP